MAFKWNLLLGARGIFISLWQATRLYYVGNLFGAFTPGAIGIEAYRVSALSRFGRPQVVISTILLERFIGIAVISVFSAIGLPIFLQYAGIHSTSLVMIIISVSALLILGVLVSLRPSIVEGVARRLPYISRIKYASKLKDFYHAYAENRNQWKILIAFSVFTVIEVIILISLTYIAARSLDIPISFSYLLFTMPLLQILLRLPVSVSGIGFQEGLYAYLFLTAGFSPAEGLAASLLLRLVALIIGYLPAILMIWFSPLRLQTEQTSLKAQ